MNDAAAYARHMFAQKQGNQKSRHDILESLTDIEVLNKAGICLKGKITRIALLFLLAADKVYAKIRNQKYHYIVHQETLFP